VGIQGVAAATTSFRGFGTQITFVPTIIDKDRIRLSVTPSFSTVNSDLEVNGIPGLNSRAVQTTVDLREGQWLAIAGLLQDQQSGGKVRVPFIGDIPIVDVMFSQRDIKREETELMILVSPELVHPLEPEEAPLILPGMEVTEPNDPAFFFLGYYEGKPNCDHRSTVWPVYCREPKHRAMYQTKHRIDYQQSEDYYIYGPQGFTP
jgi:pilus assembly protein CpaC